MLRLFLMRALPAPCSHSSYPPFLKHQIHCMYHTAPCWPQVANESRQILSQGRTCILLPLEFYSNSCYFYLQVTSIPSTCHLSFVWIFWQPTGVVSVSNCLIDLFPRCCLPHTLLPPPGAKSGDSFARFLPPGRSSTRIGQPCPNILLFPVKSDWKCCSSNHLKMGYSWNQAHFRDDTDIIIIYSKFQLLFMKPG